MSAQAQLKEVAQRVFVLYEPPAGTPVTGDLVFVHGLNSNEFKCWTNKGEVLWPKEFIPNDFSTLRVISIGYSHHLWGWGGGQPSGGSDMTPASALSSKAHGKEISVEECAAQVFQRLIDPQVAVGTRPLVFVTHSMGGLVIKQMLLQQFMSMRDDAHRFLDWVEGVVFYATPHFGSPIASVVSGLEYFVGNTLKLSGVVTALGDHNVEQLTSLNKQFLRIVEKKGIRLLSFGEGRKLNGLLLVVDAASANPAPQFPQQHPFHIIDEDHTRLNTPESPQDPSYTILRDFLGEILVDDNVVPTTLNPSLHEATPHGSAGHHIAIAAQRSYAVITSELIRLSRVISTKRTQLFGIVEPSEIAAINDIVGELMVLHRATSNGLQWLRDHRGLIPAQVLLFWCDIFVNIMDRIFFMRQESAVHAAHSLDAPGMSTPGERVEGGSLLRTGSFTPREGQLLSTVFAALRGLEIEWRAAHRSIFATLRGRPQSNSFASSESIMNFLDSLEHCFRHHNRNHVVRPCISCPTPERGEGSVSRDYIGDVAFVSGWYELCVTRDAPKAREHFEDSLRDGLGGRNQVELTDVVKFVNAMVAAEHEYNKLDLQPQVYQPLKLQCRTLVSHCAVVESFLSVGGVGGNAAIVQRMERHVIEAKQLSSTLLAIVEEYTKQHHSAPSRANMMLRKKFHQIRRGGSHGDGMQAPSRKLVHDCCAYFEATYVRYSTLLMREGCNKKENATSSATIEMVKEILERGRLSGLPTAPSSSSLCPRCPSLVDASRTLDSEWLAATCRLKVERMNDYSQQQQVDHQRGVVDALTTSLHLDPHNTTALLQRAKLLHDSRRYDAAADLYHEIIKEGNTASSGSTYQTAMVGLGWTYLQRVSSGVSHDATVLDILSMAVAPPALVSALQDVPSVIDDSSDAVPGKGSIVTCDSAVAEFFIQRAICIFKQVLDADPAQPWALCGLGRAYTLIPTTSPLQFSEPSTRGALYGCSSFTPVARQRLFTARKHFAASWKLSNERCHWAAYWLGDCCLAESKRSNVEEAIRYYRLCIATSSPHNSWALTSLALLLEQQRQGVAISPSESQAYAAEVQGLLEKAVSIDPSNVWGWWALSNAENAALHIRNAFQTALRKRFVR